MENSKSNELMEGLTTAFINLNNLGLIEPSVRHG